MNTAEVLVKLLENDEIKYVFGHPGEQILPFYKALSKSSIKHILTRHEQGAVHSSDAYARSTGKYSVVISTAGPGAMNLVMGLATAFKDNIPLLVITGDNDYSSIPDDKFQSFPINNVFKNMTIKSYHPSNGKIAISNFKEALLILKKYPKGPVHINLSKDVLMDEDFSLDSLLTKEDFSLDSLLTKEDISLDSLFSEGDFSLNDLNHQNITQNTKFLQNNIYLSLDLAIEKIANSEKPLIIVGNGIVWAQAIELLNEFITKHKLPITTSYPGRGIVSEDNKLNLGMVGLRGNSLSDYAYLNSDCIIVLGARLSERTISKSENFKEFSDKIIHVNIDKNCLKGKINICMDVYKFLEILLSKNPFKNYNLEIANSWINEIYAHEKEIYIEGIEDREENYNPLKPQYVINKILDNFKDNYVVSDAGTHTTWTTLLKKSDKFAKLLFSGGFGPMGFAVPGAIGVAIAYPNEKIIVICGDGDIQMVSQELATINEYNLNITIFVINNSQLGIIRQWEETIYGFDSKYQVDLINPDFVKLANAYHIDGIKADDKDSLNLALKKAQNKGPLLVDVIVSEENMPMPK